MSSNEERKNIVEDYGDHEERLKNAKPRYLTDTKKHYLLASSQESLDMLLNSQNAELTRILISLKSEHDQITLESNNIQRMLDEYDKKINMLLMANESLKSEEEKIKQNFEFMEGGINSKKDRKNEEEFTQKSLIKQREKLTKDILILQKEIVKKENESIALDKKIERASLDQNIIRARKNQVYSKMENQKMKNKNSLNENDLKIKQYKKMIELKSTFLKFADQRKELQNKITQQAKNDSLDKQEVEKRKTLKLLMLYNQYLRTLMSDELKENEEIERVFGQIRDICGTKNIDEIVDFILLRNKRYNYACREINECEEKNKELKKEIKSLKNQLIKLKNDLLVQEKDKEGKNLEVEVNIEPEKELEIIYEEKEKNEKLLELGKRYNNVDEAYQKIIDNINKMLEKEKEYPLENKAEQVQKEKIYELTNDEIKNYMNIDYNDIEKESLQNYELSEKDSDFIKTIELSGEEIKSLEKVELNELEKIIKKDELILSEEEKGIIEEIQNISLKKKEKKSIKLINLREEEEAIATQKLQKDKNILSSEEKNKRIEYFKELKMKFRVYMREKKKEKAKYQILQIKKNKNEMINNFETLLKSVSKTFDVLYLCHSKQEFLNLMKEKEIEEIVTSQTNQIRGNAKKSTKRATQRRTLKLKNIKTEYDKHEEDDKSTYDVDIKIMNKFLKEQKKEKENFVSGKIKIVLDDNK